MLEITSRDNARLKNARAVRDGGGGGGGGGRQNDLLFAEGLRLSEELAATRLEITEYFFTAEFARSERGARLLDKLAKARGVVLNENLLASISDTKTPPGIIVLAKKPATSRDVLEIALESLKTTLLIVLHQLNNPANVGAILRTAEAAGATGAILTRGSANVFSPRALRGAMGSAFRLPIWANAEFSEVIQFCRARQIKTICAELNARKSYTEIDWNESKAVLIGQEANGLSSEEIIQADESVRIPMRAPVESLNAAVAGAVILYEAARQRQLHSNF